MKSSDLISVSTFRSREHAQKAKRMLDEAGLESMIRSDPVIMNDGSHSRITSGNATGGWPAPAVSQLMVRAEDLDKAREALHGHHLRKIVVFGIITLAVGTVLWMLGIHFGAPVAYSP